MKRLALLVPLALALAVPAPAAAARDRCLRPGDESVRRDAVARIYERGDVLFGCLRATGRRRALTRRESDGGWGLVDLSGRFVTWSYRRGDASWIVAADLRSRSRRAVAYDGRLTGLEVSATGGVAYVLDGRQLWLADGGGQRLIQTNEIEPASFLIDGATLRWRGSGVAFTARVDGGTTCRPALGPTRAWDDVVRAYDRGPGGPLFGCAWLRSRPIRLTTVPHEHVEAAGRFIAWSEPGTVAVHDVLRGRQVRPAAGPVVDLALGGDGAVAWLESDGRLLSTRGTVGQQIAAGAIEPGSLEVRLGVVRWRQDGEERSAPVPG